MFNWVSREKRIQTIDPKVDSPPVGYYSPNYSLFDYKRGSDIKFGTIKLKNEDSFTNSPKKLWSKLESVKQINKLDDIKNDLEELVKIPGYLQKANDAIQKNKYGNKEESIGKVLLKSLSPSREPNTSRLLFDKQLAREYIKTWMNSPHESRFELKNNFPDIISKNRKYVEFYKFYLG